MKKFLLLLLLLNSMQVQSAVIINHKGGWKGRPSLLSIFSLQSTKWEDSQPITVFVAPLNSIQSKLFAISVLNISITFYKKLIENAAYEKGDKFYVTEVETDKKMYELVANTPNSIGFIDDLSLVKDKLLTIIK